MRQKARKTRQCIRLASPGSLFNNSTHQNPVLAIRPGLPHARCLSPERPRLLEHLSYIGEEGGTGSDVLGRGRTLPTEYDGRHLGGKQIRIDLCSQANSLGGRRGNIWTSQTRSKTYAAGTRWSPHMNLCDSNTLRRCPWPLMLGFLLWILYN